ncbi:hypothetical protein PCK2_001049, partial [Pneumocystis canis]
MSLKANPNLVMDHEKNHYYIFQLAKNTDAKAFSNEIGFTFETALENLDDYYILSIPKDVPDHEIERRIYHSHVNPKDGSKKMLNNKIISYDKQIPKKRQKRSIDIPDKDTNDENDMVKRRKNFFDKIKKELNIRDPGFEDQWHLVRCDINIVGAWKQRCIQYFISVNIDPEFQKLQEKEWLSITTYGKDLKGSWNFNRGVGLGPPLDKSDTHGTRCAGEVAAAKNDFCGLGVAYEAKVAGLQILSAPITDYDESRALTHKNNHIHIYSCSWGPEDDGKT